MIGNVGVRAAEAPSQGPEFPELLGVLKNIIIVIQHRFGLSFWL
jgi:hypothetical protein